MTVKELLTPGETGEYIGKSRAWTYNAIARGILPGVVKFDGQEILVRRRVLDAWLAGQLDTPAPPPAGAR